MKISVLKICIIVVLILLSLLYLGRNHIFEFHRLFEPDPIKIEIEAGKRMSFDFEVRKRCTHNIGIAFSDERGGYDYIKQFFGPKASKLNLPAKFDILVINSNSDVVFSRKDFGGSNLGYMYGPNPVRFIAGRVRLFPGSYKVKIFTREVNKDFSAFEAHFFASHPPKTWCG